MEHENTIGAGIQKSAGPTRSSIRQEALADIPHLRWTASRKSCAACTGMSARTALARRRKYSCKFSGGILHRRILYHSDCLTTVIFSV